MLRKLLSSGLAWVWVALLVIGMDHYSKMWVMRHLAAGEPIQILPFFNLSLAYNTGAAFSFLHDASGWQNWFLGGLAVIASLAILIWLARQSVRLWWMCIAMSLIMGGALGNMWDRIVYGFVIDFLGFHIGEWHFAIFNIADAAICIGVFMILMTWLRQPKS